MQLRGRTHHASQPAIRIRSVAISASLIKLHRLSRSTVTLQRMHHTLRSGTGLQCSHREKADRLRLKPAVGRHQAGERESLKRGFGELSELNGAIESKSSPRC